MTSFQTVKSMVESRYLELKNCGANSPGGGGFSAGNTCARGGGSSGFNVEEIPATEFQNVRKELRTYYKEEFASLKGKGLATADEFNEVPKIGQAVYMMDAALLSAGYRQTTTKALIARNKDGKIVGALSYVEEKTHLNVGFMGSTSPIGGFKLFKNVVGTASAKGVGLNWTSSQSKNAETFWKKTGFNYKETGIGLKFSLSSDEVKTLASGKLKVKALVEIETVWPTKLWPGAFVGDLATAKKLVNA